MTVYDVSPFQFYDECVPWGATTSAHRIYPVCTIYPVRANIVRLQTDNDRHIFIGKPFA